MQLDEATGKQAPVIFVASIDVVLSMILASSAEVSVTSNLSSVPYWLLAQQIKKGGGKHIVISKYIAFWKSCWPHPFLQTPVPTTHVLAVPIRHVSSM